MKTLIAATLLAAALPAVAANLVPLLIQGSHQADPAKPSWLAKAGAFVEVTRLCQTPLADEDAQTLASIAKAALVDPHMEDMRATDDAIAAKLRTPTTQQRQAVEIEEQGYRKLIDAMRSAHQNGRLHCKPDFAQRSADLANKAREQGIADHATRVVSLMDKHACARLGACSK